MITLLISGIAHLLGDYLLQSRTLAREKDKPGKAGRSARIKHIALYAAAMGLVFLCAPWRRALPAWAILASTHGLIDCGRVWICGKKKWTGASARLHSFCADQALHLGVMIICWLLFLREQRTDALDWLCGHAWFRPALLYAVLLGVIWQPTSILASKVLAVLPQPEAKRPEKAAEPEEAFRSGELIGKLERVIVAALVLADAATAIGFVLTAKSVARFKQMEEDRNFAERYLVGTLLSVAVALTAALLVKHSL